MQSSVYCLPGCWLSATSFVIPFAHSTHHAVPVLCSHQVTSLFVARHCCCLCCMSLLARQDRLFRLVRMYVWWCVTRGCPLLHCVPCNAAVHASAIPFLLQGCQVCVLACWLTCCWSGGLLELWRMQSCSQLPCAGLGACLQRVLC